MAGANYCQLQFFTAAHSRQMHKKEEVGQMHDTHVLVRSDLPWAGGALDLFCIISELCVAALQHCSVHVVFAYVAG
jgi:hypothetical protein